MKIVYDQIVSKITYFYYYYSLVLLDTLTFKFFKYEISETCVILLLERSKCSRWTFCDKDSIVHMRFPESPSHVNSFRSLIPARDVKQFWARFNIFKWWSLDTWSIRINWLFCAESWKYIYLRSESSNIN